jgi:hypothetical protein
MSPGRRPTRKLLAMDLDWGFTLMCLSHPAQSLTESAGPVGSAPSGRESPRHWAELASAPPYFAVEYGSTVAASAVSVAHRGPRSLLAGWYRALLSSCSPTCDLCGICCDAESTRRCCVGAGPLMYAPSIGYFSILKGRAHLHLHYIAYSCLDSSYHHSRALLQP